MSELTVLEWLERYDNYVERFSHQLDSQNLTRAVKYMRALLADRDALVRYVMALSEYTGHYAEGEAHTTAVAWDALSQELKEAINAI